MLIFFYFSTKSTKKHDFIDLFSDDNCILKVLFFFEFWSIEQKIMTDSYSIRNCESESIKGKGHPVL